MTIVKRTLLGLLLVAASAMATAQMNPGYEVPCVGCESPAARSFPETGIWDNPDNSGSGFVIEVQNGVLVAYYFGYDEQGDADWFVLSAPLEESDESGVMWEAEGNPVRLSQGSCLGCDYQEPDLETDEEAVRFEFLQRANARVILADGQEQFIVPFAFGSPARTFFPGETDFRLPTLEGTLEPEFNEPKDWVFTFEVIDRPGFPGSLDAYLGRIFEGVPSDNGNNPSSDVVYLVDRDEIFLGSITCGPDQLEENDAVVCIYDSPDDTRYIIPLANFTDSRIVGTNLAGTQRMVAYRLNYD